ncbi:AsnC family protein [Microbacterium halotolerans]|uniref:AsnC family protein n=1 Tax=Microbacterium halotolerans TaxID=246613 RepID=UPI000E6A9BBC|nr:AsnC family protein [Microbacterium halotolerans]
MITTASSEQPQDPIPELFALAERRRELSRDEAALVRRARVSGYSWEAIATALGITRQAAHKRFGKRAA